MDNIINLPKLAIVGGTEILQNNASQAYDINLAWDVLWQKMFVEPNVLWTLVVYIASFIVSFTFIAFAIAVINSIITGRLDVAIDSIVWILIVLFLLSNNAKPIADINLFIRDFTHVQVRNIYEFNLLGVQVNEAMTDILVSGDVRAELGVIFADCDGKSGTAQINCMRNAQQRAQEAIRAVELKFAGINLTGVKRLFFRVANMKLRDKIAFFAPIVAPGKGNVVSEVIKSKEYVNPVKTPIGSGFLRWLLKNIQWMMLNGIEAALVLSALYGPVAAAASTVPLATRPLTMWFFSVISLSSVIWSYAILVSFIAMVISLSNTQLQSEFGFLMFLALGSPFIAFGLSKGGGTALLSAIGATSLMITRFSFGLVSGLINLAIPFI